MSSQNQDKSSETILSCTNLYKTFSNGRKKVDVLQGITLQLKRGSIYTISGPSGSGKSTLLSLLGLLDRPSSGTIFWKKQNLTDCSELQLATYRHHQFGYIFQNASLLPSWTALENVEAALLHTATTKVTRRKRATFLLELLGLQDKMTHLPGELSTGQKQKVAIARALAARPSLILADEPTGNVDPGAAQEITELLASLTVKEKITLVVVTHGNFPLTGNYISWHLNNGILC